MSTVEARDAALAILYTADLRSEPPEPDIGRARVARIVAGVTAARDDLDAVIESRARGWRIGRMPAIDRAILRIAVWELRTGETPIAVVISEAVRMAQTYSTERSGAFVNGVLAAVARADEEAPEDTDGPATVDSRTDL